MKNLFAIPRLSLSEAFTILITLVVCLAGFTEAETYSNYRKEDSNRREELNFFPKEPSYKENDQNAHESSNEKSDKLKQNYFAYLKSLPEYSFDKLNKRQSDYFGASDESDCEKEKEAYNYDDDDEYYHFNYKRNDENMRKTEKDKLEKEKLDESDQKKLLGQTFYSKNIKDNDKDLKTIEMLNFKEIHPNIGSEMPQNPLQNQKPFANDMARKKIPSSDSLTSLNIIGLKEDSAIDENARDRKEESSGVLVSGPSDSKMAEAKKAVKTTDEKDSVKLKDPKLGDDSEKKDKEASLKDGKEVVAAKNIKESSKTSEEKEKGVKLSDAAKLEENIEKMSSKNKETEAAKLTKEEKDMLKFSDKVTSDAINAKEISQINNRASFVSNDYKDSFDAVKTPGDQIAEKNSEEINENEKHIGLRDYQKNFRQDSEKLNERQSSLRKTESGNNYELLNGQYDVAKVVQEQEKSSPYFTVPIKQEFQYEKPKDMLYKKRESWKDVGSMSVKTPQQQQSITQEQALHHYGMSQDQQSQQPQPQPQPQPQLDMPYEPQTKSGPFQTYMPANELENTEYHKNYLKFLKKYKNQNENSKNINPEPQPSVYDTVKKISFREKAENKNKKRSGKSSENERRSMLSEEMSQKKEKEQIQSSNLKKNNYRTPDTSQSEKCTAPTLESQLLSVKTGREDRELSKVKKYKEQPDNNRLRRKSPLKLEYEIKVINQNQQDPKNVQLSRFSPMRSKKDMKSKLATGDKYLKKYPFSQVSRDDLINLHKVTGSENERKSKRKAALSKGQSQKLIRTRAAPSGYYSNRVKFGQKSYARNNEKANSDPNTSIEINRMSSPSFNQAPAEIDKNIQRGWEAKQQNFRHDAMKRFDEGAYLNEANSLFLVKKGDRTAKAFEEGTNKVSEELDPEQLAKILSKANDYVVLKKTDNNKFRKISQQQPLLMSSSDFDDSSLWRKQPTFEEQLLQDDNMENNERAISFDTKNLRARSSNLKKDDKKYSATFRSSTSKSNFKKTFDKFRDLADFFKDNEQEPSENQYSAQEVKEGRDIVFSEDKLPDPIIISSDGSEKIEGLKQKPQNSIYSISTNFKNLDQQGKKSDSPNAGNDNKNTFMSGIKSESIDFSWEPALKSAFPEAKSINAINKNGNEIIVLDFNRNQLKTEHGFHLPQKMSPESPLDSNSHSPSPRPISILGDRKVQLILDENPLTSKVSDNSKNEFKKNRLSDEQNKNYEITSSEEKHSVMSVPLLELTELPSLLKSLLEKNPNKLTFNTKSITKKSKDENEEDKMSENYDQFPRDLDRLSKINKNSLVKENILEPGKKRSVNEITLPSSSFSELSTYSDTSIRHLGNLLQNVVSKDSPVYTGYDSNGRKISKKLNEYQNLDDLYQSPTEYEAGFALERPSQWFPPGENYKEREENVPKELKDDINDILQNQEMSKVKEKIYSQLREEIERASDKIHRLRREGMEKGKLKKAIENAMSFKESASPGAKSQGRDTETAANSMTLNSNDLSMIAEERKKDKYTKPQLKKDESSEEEKSLDSDYDRHLSEFFENLNKSPKNPIESAWNRQKRFSKHDVKDKVSKTEVQNKILKNLREDNYQSVYSPGIKRRLLSIENEAENSDGFTDGDELDKNTAEEAQGNCEGKGVNKIGDPMILKLFSTGGFDEEKSRSRRSLINPFHSNFKREIDLDESMPNDFQNFLVTSLGGVGSQKREVVKKDEVLWGGKETSQDNYNQIVESSPAGKEASEDSALEKREVSSSENRKSQSCAKSGYYTGESANFAEGMNSFNRAEKKTRSDSKSKLKSKASEFADEKLPTQIRIQISNGSGKEKKSSKPIMEESETTSTDMENLPKEKEFFDKNKINPLPSNVLPKFHQVPKSKFSRGEFEESENKDLGSKRKPYHPYRRKKRKRKKYIPENPTKPVKDFITFDQKAMESLLRRYKLNQNMMSDQTTQKIPVSHPLPQVETVYNPTQGTDKAQLQTIRLGKISSISNKDVENSKNSLQSNDASTYDEGIIRSYLKSEKMKSNKGELKEFEDVNWKPFTGRLELGQESGRDNQFGVMQSSQKTQNANAPTFSHNADYSHFLNFYTPNKYSQKLFPSPYSRYFYHPLSQTNAQSMYDTPKQKQDMKSQNILNKDYMAPKPYTKPYFFNEGNLYKQEEKEKMQNPMTPYPMTGEGAWNLFDHTSSKKPYAQKYKIKDYYPFAIKSMNQAEHRLKNPYLMGRKYTHNLDYDKSLNLDLFQPLGTADTYRDADYSDSLEYDYLDEDPGKESQLDEPIIKDVSKKSHLNRFHETPGYYHLYKASDPDENMSSDEDDEFDEDYEENADEEDLEDYSLLANANALNPKSTKNNHESEKFQDDLSHDAFAHFGYYYPQVRGHDIDLTKFISNLEDRFDQGVVVTDFKNDPDLFRGSTSLLRKANENSNLFGKNVMKNLNRFNGWNHLEKLNSDKILENFNSLGTDELKKSKLYLAPKFKRSYVHPQIGSRLFYAAKSEINDRDLIPTINIHQPKDARSSRHSQYKVPSGNPFSAEFAGLGNDFDEESKPNEKHVNENLMIKGERDENSQKHDYSEDVEDVKENLECGEGTTSRDGFPENIIGKYTMLKTIKPSTALNGISATNEEKQATGDSEKRNVVKRSLEYQKHAEKGPRIIKKRLSSGHLTENNFRKYHKKNLNRKRHTKDSVSSPYEVTALSCDGPNIQIKNGNQKKRSALDLFKKITNKDRDSKKAENSEGRTAGFEPLLSLADKKYDNSLKHGKDSFVQDKKSTSEESAKAEIKGNLPELKAHAPNEGQHLKAQINEKKGGKSKQALQENQASSAQGPWKIELNDKYDFKAAERSDKANRKSLKSVKIMEARPLKDESENLKAFLVISKNVEALGRNSAEGFFPTSGSLLTEVGSNYRPKSDEGRGISKKHVRKRSLASAKARMKPTSEDAEKTSDDQTVRKLNAENCINPQEKNRALHDTKSLFEGDPKPQASHVLQRNAQKNRSSVNPDEKCENYRFLSRERLMKSVFPPISDENIIRDSRHINEETSEYLGQQIVDAILSHVSANPKFKQLIAPGLNVRTAAFKEDVEYNKKRALHQVEFSEQLQTFFKKFTFDLERLAEKHVKKRMCHQIDKQSKLFLQSLLKTPAGSAKEEKITENNEKICPSNESCLEVESDQGPNSPSFIDTPETVNLIQMKEKSLKLKQQVLDNLKMKQGILLKLIDDYQNLSNVEKGAFDVNYRHLIQELNQINQELAISENQPSLISTSDFNGQSDFRNKTRSHDSNKFGFQKSIKLKKKNFGNKYSNDQNSTNPTSCKLCLINENKTSSVPSQSSCSGCAVTQKPRTQTLPVFFFNEIQNPNAQNDLQTTTTNCPFEKVHSANETEDTENQKKNDKENQKGTNEEFSPVSFKDEKLTKNGVPTPQSFDLLSYENSTAQSVLATDGALKKQFSAKDEDEIVNKYDNFNFQDYLSRRYGRPTELHKLSLGDAAGLQLSLKHRGPWVSNLEVAKTLRSIPPTLPESKAGIKENQQFQRGTDQFLGAEYRNPRSLIVPGNEHFLKSHFSPGGNWNDKLNYFYKKPIFSYSIDKKFFIPKIRPFENASQPKWPDKDIQISPLQYFLRKTPPPVKKCPPSDSLSQGKPLRAKNPLRENFEKKRKRRIPHFFIHRQKGFARKHKSPKV